MDEKVTLAPPDWLVQSCPDAAPARQFAWVNEHDISLLPYEWTELLEWWIANQGEIGAKAVSDWIWAHRPFLDAGIVVNWLLDTQEQLDVGNIVHHLAALGGSPRAGLAKLLQAQKILIEERIPRLEQWVESGQISAEEVLACKQAWQEREEKIDRLCARIVAET